MIEGEEGREHGPSITVVLPRSAFEMEAIKRAAYQLSDRLAVALVENTDSISCQIFPLQAINSETLHTLENEFRIEVLDQDLRLKIAKETEGLRNLILSVAFSKTGLQE